MQDWRNHHSIVKAVPPIGLYSGARMSIIRREWLNISHHPSVQSSETGLQKIKRRRLSVVSDELYHAVVRGRLRNVQVLVDQGADIHACFDDDMQVHGTVTHVAAFYGHRDLLAFFLNKGLDVNTADRDNCNTPLHLASRAGRVEVVQYLLKQNANMHAVNVCGQKAIHVAVKYGQKDVVQLFLKTGMDVQDTDGSGSTLLHTSCLKGNLEMVQLLVSYKANIHAKDADERKPIHVAAAFDYEDVVEYFLDLGMSVDETDQYGQTALHHAAKERRLKVVQFLCDRIGAKPQLDAQDNRGRTPMHMCYGKPNILNCLLDAGARSDIKDHNGRTVLFYFIDDCISRGNYYHQSVVAKMHHNFVDIDEQTKMSAAHLVIKNDVRSMDLIKLVFQHQKDLNIEDMCGKTPMNYLTRGLFRFDSDKQETLIRMIVDHGAYLKAEDCQRIVRDGNLKKKLFTDKKFCSQCLVNKFDNRDLPMLGKLPSAIPLSVLEKLKLKSSQICQIERAVEEVIRNERHCDVSKVVPPLLSMLAIESYISHYRAS